MITIDWQCKESLHWMCMWIKKKKKKGDYARKCIKSDFEMALYFSVYASKKMRKFSVKLTQGHRYQPDG